MALIRGVNSKFPCPKCLVPGDCLINVDKIWALRTEATMENVYNEAQGGNLTEAENLLKQYGLRNVEV